MNIEDRYDMIGRICKKWTDEATFQDLYQAFFEAHERHLDSLPDEELLEIAEENEL